MATNRSMRLAAYTCGLAIGVLLIAATVAKAEEFASCGECRTFYSNKATGPGGICENNPTKGCIQPYIDGACYRWCTKNPATTECKGVAEGFCTQYSDNPNGLCDPDTAGKWCGDNSGNNYCADINVDAKQIRASPCNYKCECFGP